MGEFQEMNEHLISIDKRLDRHIGVVEVILANQQGYMDELKEGLKDQRIQFVEAINLITQKQEDNLHYNYYNQSDVDKLVSELVHTIEVDLSNYVDKEIAVVSDKARLLSWVAGTIMGIVTTVIGLGLMVIDVLGGKG